MRATPASLPNLEIAAYFLIWTGGVFYSTYHVYIISNSFANQMDADMLEPGWRIISRRKDVSDYEWRMWLPFLWELAPWFLLHLSVSETLRWCNAKILLRLWYILVTSTFSLYFCGWVSLVAMILAPLILFSISQIRKPILCWAASISLLLGLSIFPIPMVSEKQQMAFYVSFAWIQLRCLSFCLDWIHCRPWMKSADSGSFLLRLLSYTFYLPLMFLGPFVSFQQFEKSMETLSFSLNDLKFRALRLILNSFRFLGWMVVTEFCLHFIYCNAIQMHHEILPFLDAWTLNGLAYCIGQFFLNKYVVVYGLMGTLAEFDTICAPPVPRCIAHISMYSDMWRHFDRGFYNFIRSYIYDPLVQKYSERSRHILLSTVCFAFVYVWHGLSTNILIWSVCNFGGVLLETLGGGLTRSETYQQFEEKLSVQNVRRWRALTASPLFILSALTMFFFLGGMEVGTVFVLQIVQGQYYCMSNLFSNNFFHHLMNCLLSGSLLRNTALLFFAYCMCQVSLEIKLIKERRKPKQP